MARRAVAANDCLLPRALEMSIECRTSRTARTGRVHELVIHPDWSVDVPHDLEAERVAVAFGGYTSCLDLVDLAFPAVRSVVPLVVRSKRPRLRRDKRGAWRMRPTAGCCRNRPFSDVVYAARHARSAQHVARGAGALEWQVEALLNALTEQVGRPDEVLDHPATRRVRELGGLTHLWSCGLHPDEVTRLADLAGAVQDALPVHYFTAAAYGTADTAFLRDVLPYRPDADLAAWFADLPRPQDLGDARAWGGWLELALPRQAVVRMLEAGIPASEAVELAATVGQPPRAIAREMAMWAAVGARLGADDLRELRRHGIESGPPNGPAIDSLCRDAARLFGATAPTDPFTRERTRLAVELAVHGSRSAVLRQYRRSRSRSAGTDLPQPTTLTDTEAQERP